MRKAALMQLGVSVALGFSIMAVIPQRGFTAQVATRGTISRPVIAPEVRSQAAVPRTKQSTRDPVQRAVQNQRVTERKTCPILHGRGHKQEAHVAAPYNFGNRSPFPSLGPQPKAKRGTALLALSDAKGAPRVEVSSFARSAAQKILVPAVVPPGRRDQGEIRIHLDGFKVPPVMKGALPSGIHSASPSIEKAVERMRSVMGSLKYTTAKDMEKASGKALSLGNRQQSTDADEQTARPSLIDKAGTPLPKTLLIPYDRLKQHGVSPLGTGAVDAHVPRIDSRDPAPTPLTPFPDPPPEPLPPTPPPPEPSPMPDPPPPEPEPEPLTPLRLPLD